MFSHSQIAIKNNQRDEQDTDIFADLYLTPTELTSPNVYEFLSAEGTAEQVAKFVPLVFGLIVTKYALISQKIDLLKKLQTPPSDKMGISTGYLRTDQILNANKAIIWHENEKKFIAHSNRMIQKTFIVGAMAEAGTLAIEKGAPLIGAKTIIEIPCIGMALSATTLFALSTVILLQLSLVTYTGIHWQRALKKCSEKGLLRDKINKLKHVYALLETMEKEKGESLTIPTTLQYKKKYSDLLIKKQNLEKTINVLCVVIEDKKILSTQALSSLLEPLKKYAHKAPPSNVNKEKCVKLVRKMLVKQKKKTAILSLQLAGWLFFTAATILFLTGTLCPPLAPLTLPFALGCLGVGSILHIVSACFNKQVVLKEFKAKKSSFLESLNAYQPSLSSNEDSFINKLKACLQGNDNFTFKLCELEAVKNNAGLGDCLKKHKDVLPINLRQGIAVLDCEKKLKEFMKNKHGNQAMIDFVVKHIRTQFDQNIKKQKSISSFWNKSQSTFDQTIFTTLNYSTAHELNTLLKSYKEIIPRHLLKCLHERETTALKQEKTLSLAANFNSAGGWQRL